MCEFCTEHGDGQVWYRNAANFARELMADLERRKYIAEFLTTTMEQGIVTIGRLESLYQKRGSIPARVTNAFVSRAKEDHFGQVVTIEDLREIIGKAATIVRLPCACRWASSRKENRCCYSVSYTPDAWYKDLDMSHFGLPSNEGLESVTKEEALTQMEALGKSGAVHSLWTMKTPFIGAICNCEPVDCLGLRALSIDIETMFRGETRALVSAPDCTGCGACEDMCYFAAITSYHESGAHKAQVSPHNCYGCGNCRHSCPEGAITMVPR